MLMKTSHLLSFALLTSMSPAAYAQYIVSGTLYVDLRATNTSAGTATWLNEANGFGADMNFTNTLGVMSITNDVNGTSIPGVLFNSSAYLGPRTVPDLEGASDRSIEVWVLNPAVGPEETLVAWGHRGGAPDGSNLSMNYGTDLVFGAAGHWGGNYDMGWAQAA